MKRGLKDKYKKTGTYKEKKGWSVVFFLTRNKGFENLTHTGHLKQENQRERSSNRLLSRKKYKERCKSSKRYVKKKDLVESPIRQRP